MPSSGTNHYTPPMNEPDAANDYQAAHAQLLASSFVRLTGQPLAAIDAGAADPARSLFLSPMAVVSHNTDDDPLFNYANRTALQAFDLPWSEFVGLPSRKSVDSNDVEQRKALMTRVTRDGYVSGYSGIRISANGRRFRICNATIWNLIDDQGIYRGQAAVFDIEA
jgi:hypothetical protein